MPVNTLLETQLLCAPPSLPKLGIRSFGKFQIACWSYSYLSLLAIRWDELHPSEQANRVVAQEILDVLKGKGSYVKWYGSK
jgi:lysophospholipase L1-like esterase